MMKTSKTISLGLALCALMACTKQAHRDYTQAPIKVKTTVVAPQAGSATSRYVGTIEPTHETPLSLETTGRVTAINVKNGTRVHKGQVLLTVDNTQALNALQGAEATLQHAQDGYDRVSQVHAKGVVSDQKMVEVESQLAQAKSIYAAAKKRLEECTLVAPCDGVVNGLTMEKGQTVIPGTKLCSILDVSGFNAIPARRPDAFIVRMAARTPDVFVETISNFNRHTHVRRHSAYIWRYGCSDGRNGSEGTCTEYKPQHG